MTWWACLLILPVAWFVGAVIAAAIVSISAPDLSIIDKVGIAVWWPLALPLMAIAFIVYMLDD